MKNPTQSVILTVFAWIMLAVPGRTPAQDAASPIPPRVGPVELPATLRPPFATEVVIPAGKGTKAPLLPGFTYDTNFVCMKWFPQGPAPATNGDLNISPDHPTSGGVSAIAPHPSNPDILYIGTVNGGVWRSDNATSTNINWIPLSDDELSLSIGGLALDPTDASGQTLVAGIGRRSSFSGTGGAQIGLLRTTNGGTNWTRLGATALAGRSIYNLAVRGNVILLAVVSTDNGTLPGLYRMTDGGVNFTNMSGFAGSGLPAGAVTHLATDPGNNARFYAHVGSTGVYRTDNSGATWVNVSAGMAAANVGQLALAVFNGGGNNAVYAAELTGTSRVYRSANLGTNWTQMDSVQANTSGTFNGFTADPANPNLVYLSGLFVRANFPYSGRVVRGDASLSSGSQWIPIASTNGTGVGTAPHTDSRALTFNSAGRLIEGDDGGIYELPVANTGNNGTSSLWRSLNGNLHNNEMHSMAYDRLSKVLIGGAQDTGFEEQVRPGEALWNKTSNGDGGDAAVDTTSLPGRSVRYGSSQNLGGFFRATFTNNVQLSRVFSSLTPLGGAPAMSGQFVTPIALNAANPLRLIFGAANGVYESTNQGNTVARLNTSAANSPAKMAYGGRSGIVTNEDVIYVGVGSTVLARTNTGGALNTTIAAYPGGNVQSIVVDPAEWRTAYVVGTTKVYVTANAGASWTDLTGNLVGVGTFHSVEFLTLPAGDAIVVGTDLGAYTMRIANPGVWKTLGINLPNAPVFDTHYDPVGNVLAASTFGRGAWLYDFNPITNVVTTLADGGSGSLRDAINKANFAACPNYIAFAVNGTITLTSSLPLITASTTILGPGTNNLTINGAGAFDIIAFGVGTTNRVSGLRLVNAFSVNYGAAVRNPGRTVLESCVISNSITTSSFGGAAGNAFGGSLFVTNCTFVNNTVRGGNGQNRGPGNNGGPGGGGSGMGGAIYTEGGTLALSGCAFLGNVAAGGNGGNGDGNSFNNDSGGNGGFPNAGTGGAVGQPGGAGGFGGGGGGGAGSLGSGFAGGAGGFGGGGGAGGARGGGGNGGLPGAGGLYGGSAGGSFSSHSGGGGGGAGLGGAVFTSAGAITIVNCVFTGNLATNGVGGFGSFGGGNGANGQGSGGAIFNFDASIIAASGNTFSGNIASTGDAQVDASTVVTTLADSGLGSLRQAIGNAAARPGADTVTFAANLSGGVILLTSTQLDINDSGGVTITATNLPQGLAVDGAGTLRVVNIPAGSVVTLDSLTITNGNSLNELGGGMLNQGATTLRRCTFVGNRSAQHGGAIRNLFGAAVLTAENCTFYNNRAASGGAGALLNDGGPTLILRHCTIASNNAAGSGGGLWLFNGPVTLSHCLIAGNTAGSGPDVFTQSSPVTSGFNFVRDGTGSGLANGVNGNLVGTTANPLDPRLGPLQNNGGPTQTLSPLPGSPVVDAGDPGFDGTGLTDQRGADRVIYGRVDIGAVEAAAGLNSYYAFDAFTRLNALGASTLTYQGDGGAYWNTDHRGQANSAIALNDLVGGTPFGTNNYYRINTAHDPTNSARGLGLQGDFTVSAWIRPRVLGGWKILLGAVGPGTPGSLHLGLSDNHTYMAFWNNDIQGSRTIPLNTWTHLAFTYRGHGGEMAIYVNGLLDSADFGRTNTVRNGDLLLGFSEGIANSYFQGYVDEFAVFNYALAPNQIEALANNSIYPTNTLPEPAIAAFATTNASKWNLREVYNHPVTLWARASAEAVATAPQLGSVSNYTSLVINRRDPETNPGPGWGFFNDDAPWAVNNLTPQGLINGDDNLFALAAHATIIIPVEDDYTFGFNSDDGARLRVLGAVFKSSSFVGDPGSPNTAIPAHRGDLLNFPRPTGASGTLGVTHLKPGSYDVEFLAWEDGGGSFAEVFAARGAKTTVDGTFSLLSPGLFAPPPLLGIEKTSPTQVRVTWSPPTGFLLAAPDVTGPWTETGTTNGQVIAISPGQQFFRVTQ